MTNPRLISARIVQKILEDKIFFGDLKKQISEKDLPFCNMLILTVLRRLIALRQVLYGFLSKKIPHKHRIAEYLLIDAIAEILYMQTAEYAVIDETVKNIRKTCDKFLGGLANAVLRKVCAQKEELRHKAETISLLPREFVELLDGYTSEQIQYIASSVLEVPPLDLTIKSNPQKWLEKLDAEMLPNGTLRLYNPPKVQQLAGYDDGVWWVQDAAAALPVATMGKIEGKHVLDLCAAPGGKTAQLCAKGAVVTALDISAERLDILRQNIRRIGFDKVKTQAIDALEYLQNSTEQFDAVLLDAPCSATGTFRRHPEVLHIKNKQDAIEQARLQRKLLNSCKNVLKVGGILVYAVCSISQIEGERQIDGFLNEGKCFKIIPITAAEIGVWSDALINEKGMVRTLPYYALAQKGMDAFFICKMQRII